MDMKGVVAYFVPLIAEQFRFPPFIPQENDPSKKETGSITLGYDLVLTMRSKALQQTRHGLPHCRRTIQVHDFGA